MLLQDGGGGDGTQSLLRTIAIVLINHIDIVDAHKCYSCNYVDDLLPLNVIAAVAFRWGE